MTMILENESYPEDSRVRKEAEALVADGLRVTVLAPRRPGQDDAATINGVTVERYWRPTAEHGVRGYLVEYGVAHLQLLPRVLRELVRGTDVIHVHNPPDSLAMLALLGRPFGRKLVYDHHDLAPELFELKFGASPLGSVLRWFQRLSFRAADAVIVTNESQRAVAVAAGADPSNVTVVRNGPSEASIVTRLLARDGVLDDPHIVFVGSLESQDGVLDLPEILDRLRNLPRRANAHLTIVGDGGALRELEREVADRALMPHVRFTGRVASEAVPELIAEADVCVDPAPCNRLNHRSTMIKIGEYLAAGRPVVAYALDETRRTAADAALYARCNEPGHMVELLDQLAGDGRLRADLAARGRSRVRALTWERSAGELRRVYESLREQFPRTVVISPADE